MFLRIFYVVIALCVAYLIFDIANVYLTYKNIDKVPTEYSIGPQDADVTIVEFLSYGCGYCREVHPTIISAVEQDQNVRYIPRPIPSKDLNATQATLLTYAAGEQGQFIKFHNTIIENFLTMDKEGLDEIVVAGGMDLERFNIDAKSTAVQKKVLKNGKLFSKINGRFTPTFVINGNIIFIPDGKLPTVEDFLIMFNETRGAQ